MRMDILAARGDREKARALARDFVERRPLSPCIERVKAIRAFEAKRVGQVVMNGYAADEPFVLDGPEVRLWHERLGAPIRVQKLLRHEGGKVLSGDLEVAAEPPPKPSFWNSRSARTKVSRNLSAGATSWSVISRLTHL